SISTCGITTDGRRSTAPSWAEQTSSSGTAITRCWRARSRSAQWPTSSAVDVHRMGALNQLIVEVFVLFNFAGLILDIFLAHSENHFRRQSEYVPLFFSIAATFALAAIVPLRRRSPAVWRDVGYLVGWVSVGVGLAGVILHLDSQFFYERTIRSLTY